MVVIEVGLFSAEQIVVVVILNCLQVGLILVVFRIDGMKAEFSARQYGENLSNLAEYRVSKLNVNDLRAHLIDPVDDVLSFQEVKPDVNLGVNFLFFHS